LMLDAQLVITIARVHLILVDKQVVLRALAPAVIRRKLHNKQNKAKRKP
jgi:hypothetical protein